MIPEMLWIDIETTGLSADTDVPLEVGLVTTDKMGNILRADSWLIDEPSFEFRTARARCIPLVREMHTENGLWKDLESPETLSRANADDLMCDWLDEVEVPHGTLPMSGSSIGSLDRPFVLKHFPKLNKHFHYRNIDISSIQEIAKLLNHEVWEQRPDSSDAVHRVLSDIQSSIDMYKFWYTEFCMLGEDEWHDFITP